MLGKTILPIDGEESFGTLLKLNIDGATPCEALVQIAAKPVSRSSRRVSRISWSLTS